MHKFGLWIPATVLLADRAAKAHLDTAKGDYAMQDEHFMRQWNEGHRSFTADLHQALNQIGRYQRTRQEDIDSSYGFLDKYDKQPTPKPGLSETAKASLRGLAASVLTVTLWMVVVALATPGPGLAAAADTPVVTCDCNAYVPLA